MPNRDTVSRYIFLITKQSPKSTDEVWEKDGKLTEHSTFCYGLFTAVLLVLFAVWCYAERDNAGGSMEKRERKITTIGKPDISSLPKDTAKMFYTALLSQALEFYRQKPSDLYQDKLTPHSHNPNSFPADKEARS